MCFHCFRACFHLISREMFYIRPHRYGIRGSELNFKNHILPQNIGSKLGQFIFIFIQVIEMFYLEVMRKNIHIDF